MFQSETEKLLINKSYPYTNVSFDNEKYDLLGIRKLLIGFFIGFEAGSLICLMFIYL